MSRHDNTGSICFCLCWMKSMTPSRGSDFMLYFLNWCSAVINWTRTCRYYLRSLNFFHLICFIMECCFYVDFKLLLLLLPPSDCWENQKVVKNAEIITMFAMCNLLYPVDFLGLTWQYHALCGLRDCKNWPAPFPGRMSYKATKPGLVSVLYLNIL